MDKIASFTVNHLDLLTGVYVSRQDKIGALTITTFDLRFTRPNVEPVMDTSGIHTIEHLGATFLRNHPKWKENVIYFGPMGCRTGFYLLVRDIEPQNVIKLIYEAFEFTGRFEGDIPGVSAIECGNYLEHDLADAKKEAKEYLPVIKNYTVEQLKY